MSVKCWWSGNNSGNCITWTEISPPATLPYHKITHVLRLELNPWLHLLTPATKGLNYTTAQRTFKKNYLAVMRDRGFVHLAQDKNQRIFSPLNFVFPLQVQNFFFEDLRRY